MAETSRNKRSQSSESADLPKAKMLKTNSFSDLHNEMNAEKCTELKEKPEEQQHSNSAPTKMETTSSPLNTVEHENKSKNETEPCNSTANDGSDLELCYKCHQSYKDKDPLLLGCLHTFCSRCILSNNYFRVISPPQNPVQAQEGTQNTHVAEMKSLIPEEAFNSLDDLLKYMEMNQTSLSKLIVTCPSCSCNSQARVVTRNGFIFNDKQESKTATRFCTNCEESAVAVRYCEDCSEDLCEQCVTAHKRVKLTKEH
uniref:B box-type domain-containing protein n=1 Tax=Ciona savignyi TaxID=51511 RepID=H2YZJ0_CIOSA